ncbi:hypothetical protein GCM10028805_08420 [Spirosoma harenae]
MEVEVDTSGLTRLLRLPLFLLTLLSGFQAAQGQNACNNILFPGNFTVDKARVCVGQQITVGTGAGIINAQYNYQYDGKTPIGSVTLTTNRFNTYSTPGSYTIIQSGSGNGTGTGTIACREITVLPVDPVKFTVKVCSGRRAIMVPDPSTLGQYDKYEIYWGDGNREQKTRAEMAIELSHTYTNSTIVNFTLTIQGIYNPPADCRSTLTPVSITLQAAATQPIVTSLKTTSDKTIDLDYQVTTGTTVQLYQKVNGTYVATGQTGTDAGKLTIQTDAKQVQCFQLVTQDACNSSAPSLRSDEVCSLVPEVKATDKQNTLSWPPYAGTATNFRFYRVRRDGAINGQASVLNQGSYVDASNIQCGVQYCYSIEAIVGQTTVTSAAVCTTGINSGTPGDLGTTVVSIQDNKPYLVAMVPTAAASYSLVISRSNGASGSFQQVATVVNQNTYTDANADASTGLYCYKVSYMAGCGVESTPTEPVCTVFLNSNSPKGIDWTAESPFTPEKLQEFIIEVIDSANNTRREIDGLGMNPHRDLDAADLDSQSQKYRIIAISEDGTISYSNFFTFRREAKIWVPDAFTPDGDGMNELFLAKGIYFDRFRMTIYDRWGAVVYSTTDKQQGWDGTVNGQHALEGQYMYRIEVIDQTGLQTVRTGAILLVRSRR